MKENAKLQIKQLVEEYNKIIKTDWVKTYNEETTKKNLILPLFNALGWKTDGNDVTAEEKISKKRVDYGFKLNGIPKFFVEAKPLKGDLDNIKYIEQAINYAWNKGCTWAVLTNFEVVKIFNAEWKTSDLLKSKFITLHCHEFLDDEKFNQLWLLSKYSFEHDLLDKEAEKWGKITKKVPVAEQLWVDLIKFRESLTKNITNLNLNKKLTDDELDESIQRILNRLVFIRNCEDRELEEKILISNMRDWKSKGVGGMVKNLRAVFSYFDEQYNSKIFSHHLCDDLEIDNEVLSEIIEGLYYTPDKSIYYDFKDIEADVLGNIYEQYLGHLLKKTKKTTQLTEDYVHRKEQGIYYTPIEIVDFIVRNTLKDLIKNKKSNVEKIRVLDPSCGSGSFLIKAFDVLNEHHLKTDKNYHYTQLDTITGQGVLYSKKLKILKNNIFGVDLDKQAVEIAQLNLLLKITERRHRLPILGDNIQCGNSLIDTPLIVGNKAFNWNTQFYDIMKNGFDVIIGNPPWGATISDKEKEYYLSNKSDYINTKREIASHVLFIELCLKLLKNDGYMGLILPNTWLYLLSTELIRDKILNECKIISLIELTKNIFAEAPDIVPVIIILKKTNSDKSKNIINTVSFTDQKTIDFNVFTNLKYTKIKQKDFITHTSKIFNLNLTPETKRILKKISNKTEKLSTLVDTNYGIKTGDNKKYITTYKEDANFVKCLKTRDISRYSIDWKHMWLNYGTHLAGYRKNSLEVPKIVIQYIRKLSLKRRLICAFDTQGDYYPLNNYSYITGNEGMLKYVSGILNSKLMNFYFSNTFIDYNIKPTYLNELPIRLSKKQKTTLTGAVSTIISLNNRVIELKDKITDERIELESKIKKIDNEIDDIVYRIYGITEKERKIIEESLK